MSDLDQNWDRIDRRYRWIIPTWFATAAMSTALAVYTGPVWNGMLLAFLAGFQLSSGMASIMNRKNAQLMRGTLAGWKSVLDHVERLHESDDRTPVQSS
jgi:hypothetical protein